MYRYTVQGLTNNCKVRDPNHRLMNRCCFGLMIRPYYVLPVPYKNSRDGYSCSRRLCTEGRVCGRYSCTGRVRAHDSDSLYRTYTRVRYTVSGPDENSWKTPVCVAAVRTTQLNSHPGKKHQRKLKPVSEKSVVPRIGSVGYRPTVCTLDIIHSVHGSQQERIPIVE